MLFERDVHSSFHCSQPFCPLFRCSWWFGRIPRTRLQLGNRAFFCGWSGRLEQSTTGHSFGTYKINVQKHAQGTSVLSFLHHWLTVSRVRAANIVRRPCRDSSHVTAPYKLFCCCYYYQSINQSISQSVSQSVAAGMSSCRHAPSRRFSDTGSAEWSERISKRVWEWYVLLLTVCFACYFVKKWRPKSLKNTVLS